MWLQGVAPVDLLFKISANSLDNMRIEWRTRERNSKAVAQTTKVVINSHTTKGAVDHRSRGRRVGTQVV